MINDKPSEIKIAQPIGKPNSVSCQVKNAENVAISPCAKLAMLVVR